MKRSILLAAWKKLLLAYLLSFGTSMAIGSVLLFLIDIAPETIFELSTKRLSYALPVMETVARTGIDEGILIFMWNAIGALATISFIYTATLFNPRNASQPPRGIRRAFCGSGRMRLLCFLPGCMKIEEEALRRLYVWLMVPLLGMILLGIETGFSASTAKQIFGSYQTGILSLVLHGIIEIPAFALAGAIPYSGHLLIKPNVYSNKGDEIFNDLSMHTDHRSIGIIATLVVLSLFIAGMVEAHVTHMLFD